MAVARFVLSVAMGAEDLFRGLFASVLPAVDATEFRLQTFCAGNPGAVIAN